jgi:hypothetical protein
MIIGLCGTHGTGKSTILKEVKKLGATVIESQLSREAQKSLGWESLDKVKESAENMWLLQNSILNAMYDRDENSHKLALEMGTPVVVERTPADVWAYTELWCISLGINPLTDVQAKSLKQKCRLLASKFYSMFMIVPIRPEIKFVAEPNRANEQDRVTVADKIHGFIWDGGLPFQNIDSLDPVSRAVDVMAQVTILKMKDVK